MVDEVREAAKKLLKRQEWANRRGRATRAYIREHPEVVKQFEEAGTVKVKGLPEYVTKSSVLLELSRRAQEKEVRRAVREWRREHPDEAAEIDREVLGEH